MWRSDWCRRKRWRFNRQRNENGGCAEGVLIARGGAVACSEGALREVAAVKRDACARFEQERGEVRAKLHLFLEIVIQAVGFRGEG